MIEANAGGSILGAAVTRAEDPRLVRGEGTYISNLRVEDACWMVPVRSPIPHGTITDIDADDAVSMPGVVGVFTASDIEASMAIDFAGQSDATRPPLISGERVRFVGDIVAVVVAESEREAVDAAQLVWVDIAEEAPVPTTDDALRPDAPRLFSGTESNVIDSGRLESDGDPLDGAEHVTSLTITHQRLAAVPLEPNNAVAWPDGDGLVVFAGSQSVHAHRNAISTALGIDRSLIRVQVPDMGGGFGAKIYPYREQVLVAELARRLQRPVRWQERRSENMVAMTHGRAQVHRIDLGATRDGVIVGARISVVQDVGAYPLFATHLPKFTQRMAAGPYSIDRIDFSWKSVVTTTTPVHAYRGAGRPEATLTLERAIDVLAAELGIDPAEIRRRNYIAPDEFPVVTATGERYDSGEYERALRLALEASEYQHLREEQRRRRTAGDRWQLGLGVASYVEVTAPGGRKDWGAVAIHDDGTATVTSGASSHGQGHETTFPQIASEVLGLPRDRIRFVQGDTGVVPRGGGTMGSRSLQMAGSAILVSSRRVLARARELVAGATEAAVEDIVQFDNGRIGVSGVPDTGRTWSEIAALANGSGDGDLQHAETYIQEHATFAFGTHVAVVEVDTETGDVRLRTHVACDDCGTIINRMIVDGQVHGGVAQGIGQAVFERVRYDESANPLTTNLTSYSIPTATVMPDLVVHHTVTPTPDNPLGAKGIGEAGTIGSGPATVNAIIDAIAHLGVRHLDMPLTPERVWSGLASSG